MREALETDEPQGEAEALATKRRLPVPGSVASQPANLFALAVLIAAIAAGVRFHLPVFAMTLLCLAAYATPLAVVEVAVNKVHRRASTGLDWDRLGARDMERVGVKLVGLVGALASVAAVHALTGLYPREAMAASGLALLVVGVVLAPLAVAYFVWVDRAMVAPEDGYYHAGRVFLGRWDGLDAEVLRGFLLGWIVKGFFLPIMAFYLIGALARLYATVAGPMPAGIVGVVGIATDLALVIELSVVCVGYTCTMRLFDSHIRSTNPFLLGWVITLSVYAPFNAVVTGEIFAYRDGHDWAFWFGDTWFAVPWGIALIVSFAVWVWATAAYGLRWSNLTNRGIITDGPYRWTKHPDYVAKVTFFWLGNLPFLSVAGPLDGMRGLVAIVGVSLIYWGRAVWEERHLSEEADYRAYALAMNRNSIFAPLARRLPFLKYRVPEADLAE